MTPSHYEAGLATLHTFLLEFYRKKRESSPVHQPPTIAVAENYDPAAVGAAARQLCEAAFAEGRSLSATAAVAQVLEQRRLARQ